jgi:MFS family permease
LVGLYIVIVALFWLAMYLYVPTLPTYVQRKSENLALVGMVLAQYGLWQAFVRLPIGIGADWLGRRKPFILVGIALAGLGAWLMGTADSTGGLAVGRAITFGFLPILATQLGATDFALSLLTSMHIGVVTLSSLVAAAVVNRVGARRLVYLTLILMSAETGAAVFASSLWMVFVIQFCLGLAQGLGYPVFMGLSIRDVEEVERTTAMGLHQSVYAIGKFAGPWLSGILADAMGIRPMFGVTAAGCFVEGMLIARLVPVARRGVA